MMRMAEYIERTEELFLSMRAGAKAISNTKKYHGTIYMYDAFSDNHKEMPYLQAAEILYAASEEKSADVAPVRRGRCDVCSGKAVLTQYPDNGYSLEIDFEQQEAALWYGDECLAVFRIDYCPNCGAKMDLEVTNGS